MIPFDLRIEDVPRRYPKSTNTKLLAAYIVCYAIRTGGRIP